MEKLLRTIDEYMCKFPEAQNPLAYIQILGSEDKIYDILDEACGRRVIFCKGRGVNELLWFFENSN